MRCWGVDTAAVSTLQPSRNEEASEWVYWEVTKVIPVNQPPTEIGRPWAEGATRTSPHTRNAPVVANHPINWDEVRGGRPKSRQNPQHPTMPAKPAKPRNPRK